MTRKSRRRAPPELVRRRLSRVEREQRLQKGLILGVIGVGVLVVGILGYGLFVENVVKVRRPVAVVSGTPVSATGLQARVRLIRMNLRDNLNYMLAWQQSLDPTDPNTETYLQYIEENIRSLESQLDSANVQSLGDEALNQLIEEELVRQEAARRGITIPPEEVQQTLEANFGYGQSQSSATPTAEPTPISPLDFTVVLTSEPTLTPYPTSTPVSEEEFRRRLSETLRQLRISEQQYRVWLEASLLKEQLQQQFTADVPTTADQVKLRFLSVVTETLANDLSTRLDAGEDFQALADELQANGSGTGSEVDWSTKKDMELTLGAEIADLVFGMAAGERSQPVPNGNDTRYLIIEVVGHEVRDMDEEARQQLGSEAYQAWLEAQQVAVERRPYDPDLIPTQP
jgi:parvulin-like peptidyl-prolyl isomerase